MREKKHAHLFFHGKKYSADVYYRNFDLCSNTKKTLKKHQKRHLKTAQIAKNHPNRPQKGHAGANLLPGPPKVQKLNESCAPEGTPGTPQGTPKSLKS